MRRIPGDRRRFAVAYALSILIHAAALFVLAVFALRALLESGAPESVVADTQITVETPAPVHTRRPAIVQTPRRVPLPVVRPKPLPRVTVPPKPPVPRELARIVPKATPLPPTPPPVAVAEPVPTIRPTVAPTIAPTVPPTVPPTQRPTVAPTERPTAVPTEPPTPEPTLRPTSEPTVRPTAEPTAVAERTASPRPAASATAAGTAVAARAAASPSPAPVRSAAAPVATPVPVRTAAAVAEATAAPTASPAAGLSSLNDKLRAALPTKPTAGLVHVDVGTYSTKRVLDSAAAALVPLEILAKTFGIITTTQTIARAGSVEYVYQHTHSVLLGRDVCRAWRVVAHPLRPVDKAPDVSKPGGVSFPGPLRDLPPETDTVEVPCDDKNMEKIEPGSLKRPQ